MRELRVAVIQLGYGDDETQGERTERVVGLVREQRGHDLVVLPELWSAGGFDYRSWPEKEQAVDGPVTRAVADAARDVGAWVHAGSIVEVLGEHRWNTSVLLDPSGVVRATYRKIHRFGFGSGEPRLMQPGEEVVVTDVAGSPGGDSVQVGLSTCYDLRFPELYRAQVDAGAQVFVVPAAWPMARVEHWRLLAQARAVENQAYVVAANTAGTHAGHEMGGHSIVVGPTGEILAEAGPDEQVLSLTLDLDAVAQAREAFPVLTDRRLGLAPPPTTT